MSTIASLNRHLNAFVLDAANHHQLNLWRHRIVLLANQVRDWNLSPAFMRHWIMLSAVWMSNELVGQRRGILAVGVEKLVRVMWLQIAVGLTSISNDVP